MKTLHLNDTLIKKLKEGEYRDGQCHFLYLRVGKRKNTWYFLRTINGKTCRKKLGPCPPLSTSEARTAAIRHAGSRINNSSITLTLQQAFDFYIDTRNPKSIKDLKNQFSYLKPWHDKKISAIKKEDIQRLYSATIVTKGHTGNRVLALIKVLISYSILHGKLEGDVNGIQTIKKTYKEQPRNNFLSLNEVKELNNHLDEKLKIKPGKKPEKQSYLIHIILKTLLFTGARKQNVLQMEKKELKLDSGIWTIPPEKSKTGNEIVCHLVPELIKLLRKLLQKNKRSDYVFVNPKTGKPFTEIRKTWDRIQKDLKFTATIHDLRRTCASLHVRHGASIKQIADMLGDSSLDMVSRVYAKTEASIMRENTNKLSKLIYD